MHLLASPSAFYGQVSKQPDHDQLKHLRDQISRVPGCERYTVNRLRVYFTTKRLINIHKAQNAAGQQRSSPMKSVARRPRLTKERMSCVSSSPSLRLLFPYLPQAEIIYQDAFNWPRRKPSRRSFTTPFPHHPRPRHPSALRGPSQTLDRGSTRPTTYPSTFLIKSLRVTTSLLGLPRTLCRFPLYQHVRCPLRLNRSSRLERKKICE